MIATDHAVQRYQERVKPALDAAACKAELEALLAVAPEVERPAWCSVDANAGHPADRYLELADGILAAAAGGICVTVMVRSGLGERERANRNRRKARERRRKRRRQRPGRPYVDESRWAV